MPEQKRGSTIAYIFLGWSLAAAVGLPLITFIASRYGWRAAYGGIGILGFLSFLLLVWRLPGGLFAAPVDLKTWMSVARNRMILLLLLITTLQMSGQFVVFTFMGPLLAKLTGAGPDAIALVFAALWGVRFHRHCRRHADRRFLGAVQDIGTVHWLAAGGHHRVGAQRRHLSLDGLSRSQYGDWALPRPIRCSRCALSAAAPALASASVSLNTSVLYIGQAIGSAIGGALFAHGLWHEAGFVAMAFVAAAVATVVFLTRPRPAAAG